MLTSKSALPVPSNTMSTPTPPVRSRIAAPRSSGLVAHEHLPCARLCRRARLVRAGDRGDHAPAPASDQLRQHAADATGGGMHEDDRAVRDGNSVVAIVSRDEH